ncbi:MAG: nucleotidyltransferase domain-containing protein [Firmicutes bacterium]|nr:nucleotidyltransferase domain-containing protein [Bacillota bacterium]
MSKVTAGFQDKLNKLTAFLEKDTDILLGYLFGSQATDKAGPLSDVDIAVLLKSTSKKELFAKRLVLLREFTKIFAANDIDLVILNEAPIALKYNILKNSKPLYIFDENLHFQLVQETISQYLDFKPVLEYHYKSLQKRIEDDQYAN